MGYFIEKQHTCIACGCVFRYRIDPTSTVGGMTRMDRKMVANHPCPTCGRYQPEMVMWSKVWHPLTAFFTLFALLIILCLATAKSGPAHSTLAQVSVALFTLIALVHLGTALADPNADRNDNLERAQLEVARRKLELVSAGHPDRPARLPRNFTFWHVPALLLVLAGPVAFCYPICYPAPVAEVPTNPELDPSVVSPGDEVKYTFTKLRLEAINGDVWRGKPTVRVQNAAELGLPETLEAEGNDRQWTTKLTVPRGSRNSQFRPWVRIRIPKSAKLEGKTLRLAITMPVTYAVMRGMDWTFKSTFEDMHTTVRETVVVKLAQESSLAAAREVFLVGIAGGGLSFLGGLWLMCLAWRLQWWYASDSEFISEGAPPEPSWQSSCSPCPAPPPPGAYDLDNIDQSKWGQRPLRR